MGGSSLALETLSLIFNEYVEGLELKILDSTVPGQVTEAEAWVDYGKTLLIVASKSGTTTESMSFFAYFAGQAEARIGPILGEALYCITDPAVTWRRLRLKGVQGDLYRQSERGGALFGPDPFGLAPAAMMGIDLSQFLWSAGDMATQCANPAVEANPGPCWAS